MDDPSPAASPPSPAGKPDLPPLSVRGRRTAAHRAGRHGRRHFRAPARRGRRRSSAQSARSRAWTCATIIPTCWRTAAHRATRRPHAANLIALDREIRTALELAGGRGAIAVNVMSAVAEYAAYVRQSCESGADAIVMGAGLPLDLPELTARLPRRRADPDPVRRARHRARPEEVVAQGAPAGRDRHRASALCRRPPGRRDDRGTRRSALRLRARAARDQAFFKARGHRRRRRFR